MSSIKKPYKLRLPELAPHDKFFQKMKTESAVGSSMDTWQEVWSDPVRHGENLFFGTVPEIFEADSQYYSKILALIAEIDPNLPIEEITARALVSQEPKSPGFERWVLMMCWLFCQHLKNEFGRIPVIDILPQGTSITPTKLLMLDQPDSDIWSEDEALSLKFVKAAFEFQMTDELFEVGVKAWGAPWILKSLALLVHYWGYAMRYEVVGLNRFIGLRGDISLREQTGWGRASKTDQKR